MGVKGGGGYTARVPQYLRHLVLAGEHGVLLDRAGGASNADQVAHALLLLHQLILRLLDGGAQVVIDDDVLADLVVAVAVGPAGHGEDQPLSNAELIAVRAHGGGEPVTLGGGRHQRLDRVGDGHRGGGGGGAAPLLDQRAAAGLHQRGELFLEVRLVVDDLHGGLAVDLGVDEVGHLGGGVVAPDGDVGDRGVEAARLERELALGAVLVQAGQGVEVLAGNGGRVLHGNQGVGVAGVAHNQHLAGLLGHLVQGLTLANKDLAVHVEQIGALHARAARLGTDEQSPVGISKHLLSGDADLHLAEQGVQGVLQLHGHTLQRLVRALASEQLQGDGLVVAEHAARGQHEQQVVGDLAGGAGDGHVDGLLPVLRARAGLVVDAVGQLEHAVVLVLRGGGLSRGAHGLCRVARGALGLQRRGETHARQGRLGGQLCAAGAASSGGRGRYGRTAGDGHGKHSAG
mmetsp:Transcript_33706/g.87422  ORF Transcript_33706/g.87422 Transcript_33706/m.87422 type:complete len:459 (-) Transcript_33706:99-1475(-)